LSSEAGKSCNVKSTAKSSSAKTACFFLTNATSFNALSVERLKDRGQSDHGVAGRVRLKWRLARAKLETVALFEKKGA
jgi:hypothetical protein